MAYQLIPTKSDDYTWKVDSVNETMGYYHFICERWNGNGKIDYVCKLSIVREAEEYYYDADCAGDLKYFYRIKIDDKETINYLSKSEIQSMFGVMERFADILNRIPN